MTEALITSLSKVPQLFVISGNSSAKYKGKSVKAQEAGKDLGVRYLLHGSIQKTGINLRITTQLIDALSGENIWTDRYDRKISDFFALQDEVVKKIIVELQIKLTAGDHAKVVSRQTDSLEAWLLRVQAVEEGFKFTREGMYRARELYQAAHEADPNWSRPLAGIAWTHEWDARRGWSKSREEFIQIGMALAQRAIDMDPSDPLGYQILGNLHYYSGDYTKGISLKEKALELAPNNFEVLAGLASLLYRGGEAERSVELFERAIHVSPLPPWWLYAGQGVSLHLANQKDRAIFAFKEAIKGNPDRPDIYARLSAVLVDLGRIDEAGEEIKTALKLSPKLNVERMLATMEFRDQKTNAWYADLLRTAGLPD